MALRISECPESPALAEVGPCHQTLKKVLQLRLRHRRSQEQQDAQGSFPLKKAVLSGALQDLSVLCGERDSVGTVKTEDSGKRNAQPTDVGKINLSTAGREGPIGEGVPFVRDSGQDAVGAPRATSRLGGQGSGLEMAAPPQRAGKNQRHRKVKEVKPKVRKLKYHQYVPPEQKARSLTLPADSAYSQLLQQQQVFLQLQILSQQQHTLSFQPLAPGASGSPVELLSFPNAVAGPVNCVPLSPMGTCCPSSDLAELLPSNLDELTVSELRQQLRNRGLPVSGTKPALLERLRPFQARGVQPVPAAVSGQEEGARDGCFPEWMEGHTPVQMDFPSSPCSLPSLFTLDQSDFEAQTDSSLDTEVYLCDSLGSDGGECSSLETLGFSHFKSFQSLDDELTEAIRNAEPLSRSESIDDILKEHHMGTEPSPSPRCPPTSSPPHPGGDPRGSGVTDADPGSSPGGGGRGGDSPLTFDPGDWLESVPDPWPFPGEYLEAPDLSFNRMVNLLVEQW